MDNPREETAAAPPAQQGQVVVDIAETEKNVATNDDIAGKAAGKTKRRFWEKRKPNAGKAEPKEKQKDGDGGFGNYIRILSYGSFGDRIILIIGSITFGGSGAALPLMTIIFGNLVSEFTEFFTPGSGVTQEQFRRSVDRMCLYFIYLFAGKFILGYIGALCFRLAGTRISAALRLHYLTSVFRQDLTYFDKLLTVTHDKIDPFATSSNPTRTSSKSAAASTGSAGAIAVSITTLSTQIQVGISDKFGLLLQYTTMIISSFIIAFTRNWKLTLVTSAIIPGVILIYGISVPRDIYLEKKIVAALCRAADLAEEVLGSVRTVKSFNAEKRLLERYRGWVEESKRHGCRKGPNSGVQYMGAFFAIYCGYAICFWFGARLYRWGQITEPGVIITVFLAVLFAVMALGGIAPPIQAISTAASASASLFAVIDRKPLIDSLSPDGLKPETLPPGDLCLKNIKFSYPSAGDSKRDSITILGGGSPEGEGLSVTFPEGKTTAIVGKSGSGKSSIVALLERWYDPQQGTVEIGGVDIKDLNLSWWRSQIGLVMQEPVLFNATVYENVANGLRRREINGGEGEDNWRVRVREACAEANVGKFVDELPNGYDTKVGEQGIQLSGGQKQRIAIARSIISKPPILILDEATSALDPHSERLVQEALDKISKGRTTILIAHRLSTIKKADKIVVLGNGCILEEGTHEELLWNPDGAYSALVKGQKLTMENENQVDIGDEIIPQVIPEDGKELVRERTKGSLKRKQKTEDLEAAAPEAQQKVQLGIIMCLRLLMWEQRHLWMFYLVALIGAMGGGAAFPVQSVLFAKFMGIFQYVGQDFISRANYWALMFFVLALGVAFFYCVMGWAFTLLQHHLTTYYRLEYFQNVLRQPISFFDQEGNSAGTLTSQLNTYPMSLQELLGTNLGLIAISIFNVIGCVILSLVVGWKLGLVCTFAAMPCIFLAGLVRVRIELQFAEDAAEVFLDSAQFASEAVGAYRTVSSLVLEERIRLRYDLLLKAHVTKAFKRMASACLIFAASESINILASGLAFWYGGRLMSTREYNTDQFFMVYIAIIQGGEAAGQFFAFTPNIAQAVSSANRMLNMRETEAPPQGDEVDPDAKGGCEVEFRNVHFKYENRDTLVFKGLDLKIKKGQFAAFVGPSGCGKTTTISLLERFYSVTSGEILIDGKNIEGLDLESYRNIVSLVAQEPTLYQGTITDNVRLGVDESTPEEDVRAACQDAYIDEFISSLPEGYNTICGAKGVGLSGGQKQRVAIARALIRNPRMLLLDEATASLDSESEKMVQKAFERAKEGRTVIAVAHRLSTIQKADVIFVFDDGKIVEQGTHVELVKKGGIYYQMCQAQALDH